MAGVDSVGYCPHDRATSAVRGAMTRTSALTSQDTAAFVRRGYPPVRIRVIAEHDDDVELSITWIPVRLEDPGGRAT